MQTTLGETDRQTAEALRAEEEAGGSRLTIPLQSTSARTLPRLLREADAAAQLRISVVTLRRIRSRGEIAHVRIGRKAMYAEQHLLEYLERQTSRPVAASKPAHGAVTTRKPSVRVDMGLQKAQEVLLNSRKP